MSAASQLASLQPEVWTSSSNEALTIYITENGLAVPFQPNFTYPIFGDSETIFGYKDLIIYLCFDHCTFLPFLNVKYQEKLDELKISGGLVDPKTKLLEFLPELTIYKDEGKWLEKTDLEVENFKIPGEQIGSEFSKDDEKYAIFKLDLNDKTGIELHKRLQILVLLFIEAGSFIDISDKLWDIYVLYKVTSKESPSIVGFVTAYNYWKYPGHVKFDKSISNEEDNESNEEIRKKISQFIILPHYQGKGLGGELYNRLFEHWLRDSRVVEIVVEDPSEQFDDLRDRQDLIRLDQYLGGHKDLKVEELTPDFILEKRKKLKMEKRQFSRLLEMLLLDERANGGNTKKAIRLFIKQRLYEKNKETLETLDEPTRLDKLQTAYESLEQDYMRILKPVKFKRRSDETKEQGGKKKK